jgi:outer membrane protein OmpA-like peptidoglycan-associated protein
VFLCATLCFTWLILTGCQTTSAPRGLSPLQIQALIQEGFEPTEDGFELSAADRFLFASDQAVLQPQMRATLERIGRLLAEFDVPHVRLDGHTDSIGSESHNARLSLRRAEVVADTLVAAGLPPQRVQTRGLGSSMPIADNATAEGRQQNRRVVIVLRSD